VASAFEHRVRRQRLVVDAATPELALALRPRLEELNHRALLPVIEAVLDELAPPGRQVRIGRLELDLGEIPARTLEAELPRRLAAELRQSLADALRGGPTAPAPGVAWRAEAEARAELLEWRLVRGTQPYWAPRSVLSLEALVTEMAADDPATLADTLRALGRRRVVLERLAAQLRDPALAAVVRVLEPVHAALVLAYVTDLRRVHRRAPLLSLGDPPFRRMLWVLAQAYLVRDPGSQFNRKSFLRSLLHGMAAEQQVSYAALLAALRTGLERMRRHRPAGASLPAVVAALVDEHERASGPLDTSAGAGQGYAPDEDDRLRGAGAWGDPDHPGEADDGRDPGDDPDLPRPVWPGDAPADAPDSAAQVNEAHPPRPPHGAGAEDAGTSAASADARPATWTDADDAGTTGDAAELPDAAVLRRRTDARSIARDHAPTADTGAGPARRTGSAARQSGVPGEPDRTATRHDGQAALHRLLIHPGNGDGAAIDGEAGRAARARVAGRKRRRMAAAAAFGHYDRAEALAYFLRNGVLPWHAVLRDPSLDAETLAASLPDLPRPLLLATLGAGEPGARRRSLDVLARCLSEDGFARLLVRLVPPAGAAGAPFTRALREFIATARDRRAFLARVVGAALEVAEIDLEAAWRSAAQPGEVKPARPADVAAWPAHLLQSVLSESLRRGPGTDGAGPSPGGLLAVLADTHPADARHFLRSAAENAGLARALARCAPAPLHARLVELLAPSAVRAVAALQRALLALPAPERRFSADEMRQAVLVETMRLGDGEAPGEGFFARVLGRLSGQRLPGAAGERLLGATEGWVHPGGVPPAQVDGFRAAVRAAAGRASGGDEDASPPVPRPRPARAWRSAEVRETVFAYLLGSGPASARPRDAVDPADADPARRAATLSADAIHHALRRIADEAPEELRVFIRRHSADRRVRERWVQILPEPALARLSRLLGPRHHAALLDTAETLAAAWAEAAPAGHPAVAGRAAFWDFVLGFLAGSAAPGRVGERLVEAFFADRAARCRRPSPPPDLAETGARLLRAAERRAHAHGNTRLRGILRRHRERLLALWAPSAASAGTPARRPPAAPAGPTPHSARATRKPAAGRPGQRHPARPPGAPCGEDEGDPVYVGNAGLVLAGAFLPHLFQQLDLVAKDDEGKLRLRDADAVSRAVHLLQYLVDGSTDTAEPLLVLNKVLCGVAPETPVERAIQPDEREREMCDRLLAAMLARWPALNNTSVAGLRETFLQREGRLELAPGRLRLTVQRKTLDVLVDQVPWSVSLVFHGWMPEPLHVTW
jgi:Contractile injection system tape measure protein